MKKVDSYGYEIIFECYEDEEEKVYREIEKFERELNKKLRMERVKQRSNKDKRK